MLVKWGENNWENKKNRRPFFITRQAYIVDFISHLSLIMKCKVASRGFPGSHPFSHWPDPDLLISFNAIPLSISTPLWHLSSIPHLQNPFLILHSLSFYYLLDLCWCSLLYHPCSFINNCSLLQAFHARLIVSFLGKDHVYAGTRKHVSAQTVVVAIV